MLFKQKVFKFTTYTHIEFLTFHLIVFNHHNKLLIKFFNLAQILKISHDVT